MLIFVSGGSASGKSALAERLCVSLPAPEHIYIATMPVRSPEDERKVARHHALRAGRGFRTLEAPDRLDLTAVPPDAAVLLECLSTFTANRMFSGDQNKERTPTASQRVPSRDNDWLETLKAELQPLIARPGPTVIVSAEVGCDGIGFDPLTEDYRRVLTALGVWLCEKADRAVEAVCGQAKEHKQGRDAAAPMAPFRKGNPGPPLPVAEAGGPGFPQPRRWRAVAKQARERQSRQGGPKAVSAAD